MSKAAKKKYVKYHNDGTIWAKGTTVGGVLEGYWEWFRKDGSKMRSGYFTHGKQSGKWTTYRKNGDVVKVTDFGAAKH
jgi:antitoxin component YwqK of YwqJK toxin-antitoxin module